MLKLRFLKNGRIKNQAIQKFLRKYYFVFFKRKEFQRKSALVELKVYCMSDLCLLWNDLRIVTVTTKKDLKLIKQNTKKNET